MMMPDSGSHQVVVINCILYIVSGFGCDLCRVMFPAGLTTVVGGIAVRIWLRSVQSDVWHHCDAVGQL